MIKLALLCIFRISAPAAADAILRKENKKVARQMMSVDAHGDLVGQGRTKGLMRAGDSESESEEMAAHIQKAAIVDSDGAIRLDSAEDSQAHRARTAGVSVSPSGSAAKVQAALPEQTGHDHDAAPASAAAVGSRSGALLEGSKVHVITLDTKDGSEDRTRGVHSDAFTRAHDALASELKQKQAALNDWLSANCITSKETQLSNKKKELSDYQGRNANAWWQRAWSWIKRKFQNLFNNTENRLKGEVASLQAQSDSMKAQKAALEKQVSDMQAIKNSHHGEARDLLNGLNSQVTSLGTELEGYHSDKTAAQTTHSDLKEKMITEHAAAAAVFTELIGKMDTAIHEKRDVFYSVSATCAQYEKEGKTACKKCKSGRACGDTCISKSHQCSLFPGCACDDTIGHDLHQQFSETKTALEDTIKYHEAEINTHNDLLEQSDKDMEKIRADKEDADKAFDTEMQRLDAYKTQLQEDKSTAEQAKQSATDALSHATDENEAAVTQLSNDLRAAIEKLKASQDEEKASKTALLIAQEATLKEFLEAHAATIAGWDAKIQETKCEKERLASEASDLSAAIESAANDL